MILNKGDIGRHSNVLPYELITFEKMYGNSEEG